MKYLFSFFVSLLIISIPFAKNVNAAAFDDVIGKITPPSELGELNTAESGEAAINIVLNNVITLIYSIAAVAFFFMLVFSAFQSIISGGNKEAVAAARGRLTWAVIGLILLAFTFVILQILENVLVFDFFGPPSS